MTVKGGTTPACAACKYQRRKCSPTCPLAPYFPADQPKIFQNVHRLFGVSKVTKTLKDLETKDQRDDAMQSIIYEADMRQRFPVDGCRAIIAQLHQKLQLAYEELHYVCANLDACRLANIDGSSSGKDAPPPPLPYHGGGQFLFEENGGKKVPTVSWIQAQMNALDIHKRSSLDFEAQQFKTTSFRRG